MIIFLELSRFGTQTGNAAIPSSVVIRMIITSEISSWLKHLSLYLAIESKHQICMTETRTATTKQNKKEK